jgi:TonB family protein
MRIYSASLLSVFLTAATLLAAQDLPSRVTVGGNIQAHKWITGMPPVYPQLARQARIQGVVRMEVIITVDGAVKEVRLISGHPLLAQAAIDAVRTYQYQPTLLNGRMVEVATSVEVNFDLQDGQYAGGPLYLFRKGETLPASEAAQLETTPNDTSARAHLLGYYTAHKQILARRETIVWFLQNDPASVLTLQALSMVPGNSLSDPEGYGLIRNLWLNHPRLNAQNPQVVQRAASFFELRDKPEAEKLYEMMPGADQFLGRLYALAVVGMVGYDDANQPIIDPAESAKPFAERARSILQSTDSVQIAMSALPVLRQAERTSGKYQDLIEHLQTLVPVRAAPLRISEK